MPLQNPPFIADPIADNSTPMATLVPPDIATPAIIAPANLLRKGLIVWNASEAPVLIDFGVAPTRTSYAAQINPGGYYEMPFNFIGEVQALWLAPGGYGVMVREFT